MLLAATLAESCQITSIRRFILVTVRSGTGSAQSLQVPIGWNQAMDGWQNHFRQLADEHAYYRSGSTDFLSTAWHACAEWVLRLLSGFLAGIGAGYVTHVALDFGTPRCLPLMS